MARDLVTGTVGELSPPGTETGPTHSRGSPAGDVGGSVGHVLPITFFRLTTSKWFRNFD